MEPSRPAYKLHILLRASVLECQLIFWKGTNHVEQQAAGNNRDPGRRLRRLEANAEPQLHVGCLKFRASLLNAQENARQRLNGTSRGSTAHGDAETREKRFTGNGELQLVLPI
jgi:hypothetical protein